MTTEQQDYKVWENKFWDAIGCGRTEAEAEAIAAAAVAARRAAVRQAAVIKRATARAR